jgi:ribonuclease Z
VPKLLILGSSSAIPDESHDNTHMILLDQHRTVLVDCSGSTALRLRQAGIDPHQIKDMILTHFHPDHVAGVGPFLMNIWLAGRKERLDIHGLAHTLDRTELMMEHYDWGTWPRFFEVNFQRLAEEELVPVITSAEFSIYSSPVRHIIPTIGLRFEFPGSKKVLAYSCDTEPCPQVERLAAGADVLIHEATGATFGHSSAAQAGEVARRCGVKALFLIHYHTQGVQPDRLVAEASATFDGPVSLAQDFMEFDF